MLILFNILPIYFLFVCLYLYELFRRLKNQFGTSVCFCLFRCLCALASVLYVYLSGVYLFNMSICFYLCVLVCMCVSECIHCIHGCRCARVRVFISSFMWVHPHFTRVPFHELVERDNKRATRCAAYALHIYSQKYVRIIEKKNALFFYALYESDLVTRSASFLSDNLILSFWFFHS